MFYKLTCYLLARWRFYDYEPQPVTFDGVNAWINQFSKGDRKYLLTLLRHVVYISTKQTVRALCNLNRQLLTRLALDGIPPEKVVYVSVDDAGSSSHWALATLRNAARLENLGCVFLDSKNVRGLYETTDRLEEGAIVYVDDFAGTGNQFCQSRDFVAENIVGNFVEFFLLTCICEEAVRVLDDRGVEPLASHIHKKRDRLLHPAATICSTEVKERLIQLSTQIHPKHGLGYRNLATMVVLSRNCPDNAPLLLRGNKKQSPFVGILPRTTDLPASQ